MRYKHSSRQRMDLQVRRQTYSTADRCNLVAKGRLMGSAGWLGFIRLEWVIKRGTCQESYVGGVGLAVHGGEALP